MKHYYVKYLLDGWFSEEKGIAVPARSKAEAYDKAQEMINEQDGRYPFGAYVYSVTYNNGNHRIFNNTYGDAY